MTCMARHRRRSNAYAYCPAVEDRMSVRMPWLIN